MLDAIEHAVGAVDQLAHAAVGKLRCEAAALGEVGETVDRVEEAVRSVERSDRVIGGDVARRLAHARECPVGPAKSHEARSSRTRALASS